VLFLSLFKWSLRRSQPLLVRHFLKVVALTVWMPWLHAASNEATQRVNDMQRYQETQMDELRRRSTQAVDVFADPTVSDGETHQEDLSLETPCFILSQIRWDAELPPQSLLEMADQVIGRCVGVRALGALQLRLMEELRRRGLITSSIVIPEQSLGQGILTLQYVPGRIEAVDNTDSIGWWQMVMPTHGDQTLNQFDLDQALENIRRLKGQGDALIDIVPGSRLGSSTIILKPGTGKRLHGYVGLDNAGIQGVGRERLNAGVTLDSPLFLYDQLTVAWNSNAGFSRRHNYAYAKSVSYHVPLGYWSGFVGASASRYQQVIPGYSEPIFYGGTTKQIEAGITVVSYRGSRYKGTALFKVFRKRVNSTVNGFDIEVQRQETTNYEMGFQHRHYLGQSVLDLGIGIRGAIPKFSKHIGVVYGNPDWSGRSTVLTANAGVYIPFSVLKTPLSYQLNGLIQQARTSVLPSEYFVIGDRYSVRGFDGQMTLASENGWTLRNELSWTINQSTQQLYVGMDVGQVSGPSSTYLIGRTLVGTVVGIRGRLPLPYVDASYDVAIGRPIKKPASLSTSSVVVNAALSIEF
jgi:hemolysin activation/secretion protein